MYRKKRYLVLVLVSAFIVLVALTPFLLSSPAALQYFLSSVNRKISGRLSIDSWLIGWQQGVLCQNVVYSNPEKGIKIAIPSLACNRGLMELILAPKNLGTVHVDSPLVELPRHTIMEFVAGGKTGADRTGPGRGSAGEGKPVWDQVYFELKARDGQVKADWEEDFIVTLSNVSVDSTLSSGVTAFDIGLHALEQGFVKASGTLNLPARQQGWLETIIAEAVVKIDSLQLGDLLRAGAMFSNLPQGQGVLNGDFQFKAVGLDHLEFSGLTELTDVSLHGGVLGDDQPFLRKFHLAAEKGRWTRSGLSFGALEILSDTLDVKASGEISPEKLQLQAQGSINLPVLFDQVPRLLNVNESVFVETGILDFTVDAVNRPDPLLKLKVEAGAVGGIFQNEYFAWESPVSLLFNSKGRGAELQVNALQFDAPFARIKGSGNLHSFVLDGVMDLDKTFADLGTIFALDWSGSGNMDISVRNGRPEDEKDRFRVDVALDIDDFMLRRLDKPVVPLHQFSLIAGGRAPDTVFDPGTGALDLQVVLSSWLGEVFLVMNGEKAGGGPLRAFYTTDSELDLAQLSTLLETFHVFDQETEIGGIMQLQAAGFAGGRPMEVRDLTAELTNFVLKGHGAVFSEPLLRLQIMQPVNEETPFLSVRKLKVADDRDTFFRYGAGLNQVDLSKRKLIVHNVRLESESLTASLERLVVPDWDDPFNRLISQFSLSADLAKMTDGFMALGLMPADTAFAGLSKLTFSLAGQDESTQEMDINFRVSDFSLERQKNILIDSEDFVFSSRLQGRIPSGEMIVKGLSLRSGIMELDATGTVSANETMRMLEISGSIKPALDSLASILGREFNVPLKMAGRPEEQFVLRYPLRVSSGERIGQLHVFSSLHADSISFKGIELHQVKLPFNFDNSMLHMELAGGMNDGRFTFVGDTDFAAVPPVIKTPGEIQVMSGVQLDDPLVTHLLSRFHPFFGGLAKPSGRIAVRLDSLWWPIGEGERNEVNFVVIFDVRELFFQSSPQLAEILSLFGLEKQELQLRDNEIYCIAKLGRIKCSPVRFLAGDHEIVLSGSVAQDSTLSYEIEVPLTKKSVGAEEYRTLEGSSVQIVIKGTTEEPTFDREAVKSAIQRLGKQAEGEVVSKKDGTREAAVSGE